MFAHTRAAKLYQHFARETLDDVEIFTQDPKKLSSVLHLSWQNDFGTFRILWLSSENVRTLNDIYFGTSEW